MELGKPAIVYEGRTRTFGELRHATGRVASALAGLGIERMDRVGILSMNRLEFLELELGISAAGATMVTVNWRLRAGEMANLLRRSSARAIFVEDRFLGTILELRRCGELPDLRTVIGLDRGPADLTCEEMLGRSPSVAPYRDGLLDDSDPRPIVFTPGPAATPTAVVWADLCVVGGRHDFTWPILHQGGTVHVRRSSGSDPEAVVRHIAEHRITHLLVASELLGALLRLPSLGEYDTSCLKLIVCDGRLISVAPSVTSGRLR